jgi:murein L,D-transpeptidase YcbB/YkuD
MGNKAERAAAAKARPSANAAIQDALDSMNAVAQAAYGKSFGAVVQDDNRRTRNQRIKQLSGVMLKQDFSHQVASSGPDTMRHQWKIDSKALASKSASDWEFKFLQAAPVRRPGESGKDVAARLRRESDLGRAFVATLHAYICNDQRIRKQVKKALDDAGLAEFAGLATPQGLIKAGGAALYAVLPAALPGVAAAGIAVAAVVVCTLGLASICRSSKSNSKK